MEGNLANQETSTAKGHALEIKPQIVQGWNTVPFRAQKQLSSYDKNTLAGHFIKYTHPTACQCEYLITQLHSSNSLHLDMLKMNC